MKLRDRLQLATASYFAACFIRVLRRLNRFTSVGQEVVLGLHRRGQPYVHAFFHDQLLMMTYSYRGRGQGRRLAVLSSRHRDGEYVSRTLERFGHIMVRGSTSRGGGGGLKGNIRHPAAGALDPFGAAGARGPAPPG